jgi:hypothetical protein
MPSIVSIIDIAKTCHEANRAYCRSLGDFSQSSWQEAPEWQQKSIISGVCAIIRDPQITPEDSHQNWMKQKILDGWTYDVIKDITAKTHPCLLPYDKLPKEQKAKDFIFGAIVRSLMHFCIDINQAFKNNESKNSLFP